MYKVLEYKEDFEVKKLFYGYFFGAEMGDSYSSMNSLVDLDADKWGAPAGYNSPISILKQYDKEMAAYSLGGLNSFPIYNKEEKEDYKHDRRRINRLVEGVL